MNIDKVRPNIFRVTLHAYELSALIAGARWAVESDELPPEAQEQLEAVLERYENELQSPMALEIAPEEES
jgi:hypothetical protein